MSGIYIPGISMPEDGWHKVIKIFSDGTVVSYYDSTELGKAIPVPDHGRLLKVLKTERECVSRDCDRNCEKCDLSLEQSEILTVYDTLVSMFSDPADKEETE